MLFFQIVHYLVVIDEEIGRMIYQLSERRSRSLGFPHSTKSERDVLGVRWSFVVQCFKDVLHCS